MDKDAAEKDARPLSDSLAPIRARTRREDVSDALRQAIRVGDLEPGTRLKEVALASALGVSRSTVREAVRELIHEGIVVEEQFRGSRVTTLSEEMLLDAADVRVALETLAAERAVSRDRAGFGSRLAQASSGLTEAIRSQQPAQINAAHIAFHETIYVASGSEMLQSLWKIIYTRIRLALTIDQKTRLDHERLGRLHEQLTEVILTGDGLAIRAEIEAHVRTSVVELVALLHGDKQPG